MANPLSVALATESIVSCRLLAKTVRQWPIRSRRRYGIWPWSTVQKVNGRSRKSNISLSVKHIPKSNLVRGRWDSWPWNNPLEGHARPSSWDSVILGTKFLLVFLSNYESISTRLGAMDVQSFRLQQTEHNNRHALAMDRGETGIVRRPL